MEKRIRFEISQKSGNLHREIFHLPCEANVLYISVPRVGECCCMGYIILKDPKGNIRLQKLLGHGEQNLAVGRDGGTTSIGGVPGNVGAGEWTLYLGIFTEYVKQLLGEAETFLEVLLSDKEGCVTEPMGLWNWMEEGRPVLDEKKFGWNQVFSEEAGWYKGDFHTHTTLSDGKETVRKAMEKAKEMELDFYVPTEHNLIHTGWCSRQLCILPGIEITTEKGHFNVFGVKGIPEKLMELTIQNVGPEMEPLVEETMAEARENGGIISLNHPFLTIWSWRYQNTKISTFDCVEIINDPTYTVAVLSNNRAIRFLDALWQDGHRIYGLGGSDAHNLIEERYEGADKPSVAGDPGTYVYCKELTPQKLLENVRLGHMCVTRFCRIEPVITMDGRAYLPGDELIPAQGEERSSLHYQIRISGLEEEPKASLIQNGTYLPITLHKAEDKSFIGDKTVTVDDRIWNWIRAEVRGKNGEFLGYVNPVYCGEKQSQFRTFGEVVRGMGEEKDD